VQDFILLRYGYDAAVDPPHLGKRLDDAFWLGLGGHWQEPPSWLEGQALWLVEGEDMPLRFFLRGWFAVQAVQYSGRVIAQYCAVGHEGRIFRSRIGPLNGLPWFEGLLQEHPAFLQGDPIRMAEFASGLRSLTQQAGYDVPGLEEGPRPQPTNPAAPAAGGGHRMQLLDQFGRPYRNGDHA